MKVLIILLFLTQACLIFAISLEHLPALSAFSDQDLTIELNVLSGFDQVDRVELLYRSWNGVAFKSLEMEPGSDTDPIFRGRIRNLTSYSQGLEYYFLITDNDNVQQSMPQNSPELSPYRITLLPPETTNGSFILISPDPDFTSETGEAAIAISYFSLKDVIARGSIKFLLDGKNITSKVKITDNLILFQHRNAVPGDHTYQVTAETVNGSKLRSPVWNHTVPGAALQRELTYSGNAVLSSRVRRTENGDEKSEDDNHSFLLNLKGLYKKLNMQSRIYLSSREDIDEQPVNRYSIHLAIPHLEFIGGDHTSYYGNYAASGVNSRGIHAGVLFKGFRLYSSFGATYRSVDGDRDSTYANYATYTAGTFKRNSLAMRMEFGTKNLLQFGLNASKTKDAISSLSKKYYLSPDDDQPLVTPKDNLVLSSDLRLALMQQKLVFGMEWAVSLYNDNIIGGAIDKDSLEADLGEDIPFDPESLENIFVINKNVSPIIPGIANSAYNIYLKWAMRNNLLNVSYSAVGGSFNSLAVNYLSQDTRVLSIYDNLNLMQNRLNLSLGFNLISDNLNDDKTVTSKSTNIFTQVMYRPSGLPYFTFSYVNSNSSNDEDEEDEDATISELDLRNNNFSFNTGYYVNSINFAPTLFTAGISMNSYSDEADKSFEYSRNSFSLSAQSSFTDYPVVTLLSYTVALNKDVTEVYEVTRAEDKYKSTYHSVYFRSKFSFQEDRLKPYADIRYSLETGDLNQYSIMGNLGLQADIYRGLKLKTSIGTAVYENEDYDDGEYSTFNFKAKLKYDF